MPNNLLSNGNFEQAWSGGHRCYIIPQNGTPYFTDKDNIFVPPDWTFWFYHKPDTWDQPEGRDAWITGDPRRVHSGQKAYMYFTFYRKHDAGLLQQVNVGKGKKLQVSVWPHAWSNHPLSTGHPDDPRWSEGAGYQVVAWPEGSQPLTGDPQQDAKSNFTFWIGIDPTGGTNPLANTVVWSPGNHIYNGYCQKITVETTSITDTVTVFLRSKTKWAFKHNDAYWDDAELTIKDIEPEPNPGWNYLTVEKGSKLGIHSLRPASIGDWSNQLLAAGTRFSVVKAVDDMDWLISMKQISPKTITIARRCSSIEGCNEINHNGDLDGLARALFKLITDKIATRPELKTAVDYWEICNEPVPVGIEGATKLCYVMSECMKKAEAIGIKLAIFSLCAGTPEWDQMVAMVNTGIFAQARAGGHILALHEGVFDTDPVDKWWGDQIPGSPIVPGAGALCFRYRYLYHLLKQRGEVIPLVVTEIRFNGVKYTAEEIVTRATWYDSKARQDYYVWGFCPFTVGAISGWERDDYTYAYQNLLDYMIFIRDSQNDTPSGSEPEPEPRRGEPRIQYERTYVLMPQDATLDEMLATQQKYYQYRYTFGQSADDAGTGNLGVRKVIAVNPSRWPGNLKEFFETYYPGVIYTPVETNPTELKLTYPTTHMPPYITGRFGDVRPGYVHTGLDLRSSWTQWNDEVVCAFPGEVIRAGYDPQESSFGVQIKTLATMANGDLVLIRYAHLREESNAIYVKVGDTVQPGQRLGRPDSTGSSTADHLHIDVRVNGKYVNPEPLISFPAVGRDFPLLGIYDRGGGEYLASKGVRGWCVEPIYLGTSAQTLDFTSLASKDIRVIANLRYSYAVRDGGQGTIPVPDKWPQFVKALVDTINNSKGLYAFTLFNEANNSSEWPKGYDVKPADVVNLYNQVWNAVPTTTKVGLGALDPFHGQTGSVMDWWNTILAGISGADIIELHGYIRGPDPALVNSEAKFSDNPMRWQYLNYFGCVKTLLEAIPNRFAQAVKVITEFNHLWAECATAPPNPTLGWVKDATNVIQAAYDRIIKDTRISGLVMYRYSHDKWRMENYSLLLQKVVELNKEG